jgi:hypothetical protein
MKLYRWNSEYWYVEDRGVLARVVRWFVWSGGWDAFRGWPLRKRLRPHYWTPVSLFGHRLTFFGWGARLRLRSGWWVISGRRGRCIYFSPDGAPSGATLWLKGVPADVVAAEHMSRRRASR